MWAARCHPQHHHHHHHHHHHRPGTCWTRHVGSRRAAPPRCAAAAAPAAAPHQPATTTTTTPEAYLNTWQRRTRPQLDALWSVAGRTSSATRLLTALDAALAILRSTRSRAVHLQQHASDPAWAAAGQQLAADCHRYQQALTGNRGMAKRLRQCEARLLQQQQQEQQQQPDGLSVQQQLQLCRVLASTLQSSSVRDGLQWLAALEALDVNVQAMQQLQAWERELVAAIDAVVAQAVAVELAAPPRDLLQPPGSQQGNTSSSSSSSDGDGSMAAAEEQPQRAPVRLALQPALLVRLLEQCPDAAVRQQLHQEVLQPKLAKASRLLAALASCRQQQAQLTGHGSYLQATQQRLQVAGADAAASSSSGCSSNSAQQAPHLDPAGLVLQLAEQLQPFNQEAVEWVLHHADAHCEQPEEQQQQHSPADWPFLHHQALQPLEAALKDSSAGGQLAQHLQLGGVVAGFSGVLQQLMGVTLQPRAAVHPTELWAHVVAVDVLQQQTSSAADGQQQQQPFVVRGTVYVDVGGGYGARMLQYACKPSSVPGDTPGGAAFAALLPAVAVGLSGSRLSDATAAAAAAAGAVAGCDTVLSTRQLWELGHELGHALHLVLSSSQPAVHLSGRFLPMHLLELPPAIMEHLLLHPPVLARVCLHHTTHKPLPGQQAAALSAWYGSRFNSALAVSGRVAASLAELMLGQYGGDGDGEDYWRGAWEAASGLPHGVAAAGSAAELSLLPVMAAHEGTYGCYLVAWHLAAQLVEPLVSERLGSSEEARALLARAMVVSLPTATQLLEQLQELSVESSDVGAWLWRPPSTECVTE